MPYVGCIKCHHEFEGNKDEKCDWCGGESKVLENKTPLENMVEGFNMKPTIPTGPEFERLSFIIERDGIEEAITFAKRGTKLYRSFTLKAHVYRNSFIERCIHYHKFVKANG